jgi:hypothetical protein
MPPVASQFMVTQAVVTEAAVNQVEATLFVTEMAVLCLLLHGVHRCTAVMFSFATINDILSPDCNSSKQVDCEVPQHQFESSLGCCLKA